MRRTPALLTAALLTVGALAPSVGAQTTLVEGDETVYLRGNGCGATEDLYLSVQRGEDEYDGCGVIGGLPLNEVVPAADTLTTRGTFDVVLDADRDATVTIRAESWFGDDIPGAGQSTVDVVLRARPAVGQSFTIGTASSEIVVAGQDNATHVMTIDVPEARDGVRLQSLTLEVTVNGANVNVNNLGMSGDSFIDLPILVEEPAS